VGVATGVNPDRSTRATACVWSAFPVSIAVGNWSAGGRYGK
jgi:hypothetical protein